MDPVAARRPVGPVFGQLYVSAAVLAVVALFVPLYAYGGPDYYQGFEIPAPDAGYPPLSSLVASSPIDSYSLWQGIVSYGELIALLAVLLVAAYVVMALTAANRPESLRASIALLVVGVAGLVMLTAEPDRPDGAVTGTGLGMLWGASLVVVATSVVHLFRLVRAPQA